MKVTDAPKEAHVEKSKIYGSLILLYNIARLDQAICCTRIV
jgi:hypothetical protein